MTTHYHPFYSFPSCARKSARTVTLSSSWTASLYRRSHRFSTQCTFFLGDCIRCHLDTTLCAPLMPQET